MRCKCIFRDNDLLKEIASQHQRALLLFHLFLIRNRIDRLDIITLGAFIASKINFQPFANSMTFFIGFIQSDNSHIHIKTAYLQLIENDILHSMSSFQLAEIETSIPQPQTSKVIFDRCVDILLTLNIISDNTVNQEGITKIINIPFDGGVANGFLLDTFEGLIRIQTLPKTAPHPTAHSTFHHL